MGQSSKMNQQCRNLSNNNLSYLSVGVIWVTLIISVCLDYFFFFHCFFHLTLGFPAQIFFLHMQSNIFLLFN